MSRPMFSDAEREALSTLTPNEQAAVDEAVPAWCRTYRLLTTPGGDLRGDRLPGPFAGDILEAHGIGIKYRRRLVTFGLLEREIRRRGYAICAKADRRKRRTQAPQPTETPC